MQLQEHAIKEMCTSDYIESAKALRLKDYSYVLDFLSEDGKCFQLITQKGHRREFRNINTLIALIDKLKVQKLIVILDPELSVKEI